MVSARPVALEELPGTYSIHRLQPTNSSATTAVIAKIIEQPTTLFALLKSPDELSLVCDESWNEKLAADVDDTSGPWRAMRVVGELDFALTGILASLTAPLAQAGIPVFAVSSYTTDYLLVNADNAESARHALTQASFTVEPYKAIPKQ